MGSLTYATPVDDDQNALAICGFGQVVASLDVPRLVGDGPGDREWASWADCVVADEDTEAQALKHLDGESVLSVMHDALSEREEFVIALRYGLAGPERTLEYVGERLDVTREAVRQIELRALGKLSQHPSLQAVAGATEPCARVRRAMPLRAARRAWFETFNTHSALSGEHSADQSKPAANNQACPEVVAMDTPEDRQRAAYEAVLAAEPPAPPSTVPWGTHMWASAHLGTDLRTYVRQHLAMEDSCTVAALLAVLLEVPSIHPTWVQRVFRAS